MTRAATSTNDAGLSAAIVARKGRGGALGSSPDPRVLLIDGHKDFRDALRSVLEEQGIGVVAEAADMGAGVQAARETRPHLVVVDPNVLSAETSGQIADLADLAPVVVLKNVIAEGVVEAIVAAASGYLLRDMPVEEPGSPITAAAAGGAPIAPQVATSLLTDVRTRAADAAAAAALGRELSERELDVLKLLTEGKGNIEIAAVLSISPKTVQHHVSSILGKLGTENRIQAAVYAARSGIV